VIQREEKMSMKIGKLSRETGLPVVTLRYYENEGLIESRRDASSNYRDFSPEMVQRVRQIQRFRALNLTIAEMHQILEWTHSSRERCSDTCQLIERHLHEVTQRKEILIELESELKRLLDTCSGAAGQECAILRELSEPTNCLDERKQKR
jgi:DNA-binding transcriptional MerR regulator